MRITLLALGSRGDTQPFISLAIRLKEEGHSVIIGARPDYGDLVKAYGIEFSPIGNPIDVFMHNSVKNFESGNTWGLLKQRNANINYLYENTGRDAYRAISGSDAVMYIYFWYEGYNIAKKLGIPCAAAMFFPNTPTSEFPSFLAGKGIDRGRIGNAIFWRLNEMSNFLQNQNGVNNDFRRGVLEMRPFPYFGPQHDRVAKRTMPVFYGYSPSLLPKPSDWPDNIHVTGVWPALPPKEWSPPAELSAFLDGGQAPVYIGFGSMISNAEKTFGMIVKALEISGRRGVIHSGWTGIGKTGALPPNIYCADDLPHHWLFPKMSAVVHHGGAGTTATGLMCGTPTAVTPFAIDQYSWGRRVHAVGAGPAPVPFSELTAEKLAALIDEAATDAAMRRNAMEIGEKMRKEDGVAYTIEKFMDYCKNWKKVRD